MTTVHGAFESGHKEKSTCPNHGMAFGTHILRWGSQELTYRAQFLRAPSMMGSPML